MDTADAGKGPARVGYRRRDGGTAFLSLLTAALWEISERPTRTCCRPGCAS